MAAYSMSQDNEFEQQFDEEADQLEEDILILNDLYQSSKPTVLPSSGRLITDAEFDRMTKRLSFLRPDSEVLLAVTGVSADDMPDIKKVKLAFPMASINKAIGELDEKTEILKKWMVDRINELTMMGRVITIESHVHTAGHAFHQEAIESLAEATCNDVPVFAMSFKRDGVACALQYENGVLISAALRPKDGFNSVDIIEHVKNAKNVPVKLTVPISCSIRGEMECLISDFDKVVAKSNKKFANPRNMTAGAMNPQGDPKAVKERKISFVAHSIEGLDKLPYTTAVDRAKWSNQTLKLSFVRVEPLVFEKIAELEELAKTVDYETDGIVIEVNSLDDGESMGRHGGALNGNPKCKIAWKFAEQKATPTLNSVVWETGRTGRVVPVGEFDPVRLAGTNVSRCTLHNLGFYQRFQAGVGAIVEIEKSGKIIPKALRTIKAAPSLDIPDFCPSCGRILIKYEGDSRDKSGNKIKTYDLVCENHSGCPAQNLKTLVNYLRVFGVKGVGFANVSAIVNAKLVRSFADFYRMTTADWEKAGLSEREAVLAYARIRMIEGADKIKDNAKLLAAATAVTKLQIPLQQLIAAFGIPGASSGTGRELSGYFLALDKIRSSSVDELEQAPNVGSITAKTIFDWFRDNTSQIDELLKFVEPVGPTQGNLTGKSFVFTGSLSEETRDYWIKLVEHQGGKVSSSVSKNTSYVIVGSDAGQKADKADALVKSGAPITIITEISELKKVLGIAVARDSRSF
jgi:DNA ligase (NAD+)